MRSVSGQRTAEPYLSNGQGRQGSEDPVDYNLRAAIAVGSSSQVDDDAMPISSLSATASPLPAPSESGSLSSLSVGGEGVEDRLLYRVTEVAVFLNVSRSKVYELLASGDLRSVKIDRTRLVRGSDLRDYVESLRPVA